MEQKKGYVWKTTARSNKGNEKPIIIFSTGVDHIEAQFNLIQSVLNKLKDGLVCLTKKSMGKPLEISLISDAEKANIEYYEINTSFISFIIANVPELLENSGMTLGKKLNANAKAFVPKTGPKPNPNFYQYENYNNYYNLIWQR
jgi:hypothetical protein